MNSWHVGDVTIDRIIELETVGGTRFLFPDAVREAVRPIDWLQPQFADNQGNLVMCIHSYLLRTPTQVILVDTGLGNHKERSVPAWHDRDGPWLADLAALGITPDSVDLVICTHLHVDHVGWNTVLADDSWIPTFPNARYMFGRIEWDYWSQHDDEQFGSVIDDSVRPVVDAGQAEFFEMDQQLTTELCAEPTPGHSIGHSSLWIESAGQRALITGDLFHHPCQVAQPGWCSTADYDPIQAVRTRQRMLQRLARDRVRTFGMHFAMPGSVVSTQGGSAFQFLPETD